MPNNLKPLAVGTKAPDFTLKNEHAEDFKLSEHRGKRVLLSFHPLAYTGVCSKQAKSLEAKKKAFDSLNTVAVGISVDSHQAKEAWAKELGIKNTHMLSDFWPHGGVAKKYGVFREEDGLTQRSNFIVDEKGKIVFAKVYDMDEFPDIDEVINMLKTLESK